MKHRFFITAVGTDIGKSFITVGLVQQAKSKHLSVAAYKPLASGFDDQDFDHSDTSLLLHSQDLPLNAENINRISPWRYRAPLAPSMAARLENKIVDIEALISHSRNVLSGLEDCVLIEGIGGMMVPLTNDKTVLDWIEALDIPVILVTSNYLGSLSHTLTAISCLNQRRIPLHSLIINEHSSHGVDLEDTCHELSSWIASPIITVRRRPQNYSGALEELNFILS